MSFFPGNGILLHTKCQKAFFFCQLEFSILFVISRLVLSLLLHSWDITVDGIQFDGLRSRIIFRLHDRCRGFHIRKQHSGLHFNWAPNQETNRKTNTPHEVLCEMLTRDILWIYCQTWSCGTTGTMDETNYTETILGLNHLRDKRREKKISSGKAFMFWYIFELVCSKGKCLCNPIITHFYQNLRIQFSLLSNLL